jgi:hypothetical protein
MTIAIITAAAIASNKTTSMPPSFTSLLLLDKPQGDDAKRDSQGKKQDDPLSLHLCPSNPVLRALPCQGSDACAYA